MTDSSRKESWEAEQSFKNIPGVKGWGRNHSKSLVRFSRGGLINHQALDWGHKRQHLGLGWNQRIIRKPYRSWNPALSHVTTSHCNKQLRLLVPLAQPPRQKYSRPLNDAHLNCTGQLKKNARISGPTQFKPAFPESTVYKFAGQRYHCLRPLINTFFKNNVQN